MSVKINSIERFTVLKQKRDALSNQLANLQGKLSVSKEHYYNIMRELAIYGIGSIDELKTHIDDIDKQINAGLDEAEQVFEKMESELNAVDSEKASSTITS